MNKSDYRELVENGLLSAEEYEALVGEPLNFENSNCTALANPVLEHKIDKEKNSALVEKIGGEYQEPSDADLTRANALTSTTDYPGKGYRCPREKRRVTECPFGEVFRCPDYVRCEFAAVSIAGRAGGVPAEPTPEEGEAPLTHVERAARQSGNKDLQKQAAALALARRQRQL